MGSVKEKISRIHNYNKGNNSETQMSSQTSVPSGTDMNSKCSRTGCKHFSRSITATHSYHIQTQTLSIDDYNHMGKIEEEEMMGNVGNHECASCRRRRAQQHHHHHHQAQDFIPHTVVQHHHSSTMSGKVVDINPILNRESTTDGKTFKCDVVYKYYDELYGQRPSHIDERSITAPVRYSHKSHRSGTRSCCVVHVDEQELWSVESQGKDRRNSGKKYNVIGPHVVDDSISNGRTLVEEMNESNDRQHLLDNLERIVDERSTLNSTKTALV